MSQVFSQLVYHKTRVLKPAVCPANDNFYKVIPSLPTQYLREILRLMLKENSFPFIRKHYRQIQSKAKGTKMAVSFANIFMANTETDVLSKTVFKATVWKRYLDDIFSLWDLSKPDIETFIQQANSHDRTIKFTAETAIFSRHRKIWKIFWV